MNKIVFIMVSFLMLYSTSCSDDAVPFRSEGNGWYYDGDGSANVGKNETAFINSNIEDNLNVNGKAYITDAVNIGDDVNLNVGGVVVNAQYSSSIINVEGNVNVNDSLFVNKGVLEIDGELNINAGVVILSDSGRIIVRGNLNNSKKIIGMNNLTYYSEFNNHSQNVTSQPVVYNPSPF